MEVVQAITEVISTLGFPIASWVALFWYIIKKDKAHAEEMSAITDSLNANTQILNKLYERLGGEQ